MDWIVRWVIWSSRHLTRHVFTVPDDDDDDDDDGDDDDVSNLGFGLIGHILCSSAPLRI